MAAAAALADDQGLPRSGALQGYNNSQAHFFRRPEALTGYIFGEEDNYPVAPGAREGAPVPGEYAGDEGTLAGLANFAGGGMGGDDVEAGWGASLAGAPRVPAQPGPGMSANRRDVGYSNPTTDLTGAPPTTMPTTRAAAAAATMAQHGSDGIFKLMGPKKVDQKSLEGYIGKVMAHRLQATEDTVAKMPPAEGVDMMVDYFRDVLIDMGQDPSEVDSRALNLAKAHQRDPLFAREHIKRLKAQAGVKDEIERNKLKAADDLTLAKVTRRQHTTSSKGPVEQRLAARSQTFKEYNAFSSQVEKLLNEKTALLKSDRRARKGKKAGETQKEHQKHLDTLTASIDGQIDTLVPQMMDGYGRYLRTLEDDDRIPRYAIRTVTRSDGAVVVGLVDKWLKAGYDRRKMLSAVQYMKSEGTIRASDGAAAIEEIMKATRGR